MATIIDSGMDPSEEATQSQVNRILMLIETRRVSVRCASRIIDLLIEEPKLSDSGLDLLKRITHPE